MKLLIDPHVYINKSGNGLLLYDTRTGKNYFYGDNPCTVENNAVIDYPSGSVQAKRLTAYLTAHGMGREITADRPPLHMRSRFEILHNGYESSLEDRKRNMLKDLLVGLTLQVNQIPVLSIEAGIQSFLSLNPYTDEYIDVNHIRTIFEKHAFLNLGKITLTGQLSDSKRIFRQLTSFFKGKYPIEICCPASDFINGYSHLSNVTAGYRLITTAADLIRFDQQIPDRENIRTDIYVKDAEGLEKANMFAKAYPSANARIIPYFSRNTAFLRSVLTYSPREVLRNRHSEMSIVRKGLINELLWGRPVICNNGDIYTAPGRKAGNIRQDDFENILIRAFQDNKSWRLTRAQFHRCGQCCFNRLCPPVTPVELLTGKIFCNRKNINKEEQ